MKSFTFYFHKWKKVFFRSLKRAARELEKRKYLLSKLPGSKKIQPVIDRYKFTFGVIIAIGICLSLTVFSVFLYEVTGTAKLDLSRPGYEGARQKIATSPPSEKSFDPGGPLDGEVLDDYLKKYKTQSQRIDKYDNFDPHLLDDTPLGLSSTQVGPSSGAPQ